MHNSSRPRKDKDKILPNGIPDIIFSNPGAYEALEFKVLCFSSSSRPALKVSHGQIGVENAVIDDVASRIAPTDHPVMELVPDWFEGQVTIAFDTINEPKIINFDTFWDIYKRMKQVLDGDMTEEMAAHLAAYSVDGDVYGENEEVELLAGLPAAFPEPVALAARRQRANGPATDAGYVQVRVPRVRLSDSESSDESQDFEDL
jgi:hypothetical protein